MNPDEYKILAHATRARLNIQEQRELRRLLLLINDKDRLIDMAIIEGLAGLCYKNFMKSKALQFFSDYQQKTLHAIYYRAVQFNIRLIRDLKEIIIQLEHHGLEVVFLQGIDLLTQVYDDVGLRPLTDIDLWILEKDRRTLEDILTGLGYRKDPLYRLKFRKKTTLLDLHTHILWADRIEARRFLLEKSQNHIYQNTLPTDFEGLKVRCLNRYDRIIYLSLHLLKHDAQRLMWLVDIQNLVTDWKVSDWEAMLSRAKELGQAKCIAVICFLLEQLLGFRIDRHRLRLLKSLNVIEKKILRQRIKKGKLPQWSSLLFFSSGKGLKKRIIFIIETLFPRPDILRQVFPNSSDLNTHRLYLQRIRQLLALFKKEWPFF